MDFKFNKLKIYTNEKLQEEKRTDKIHEKKNEFNVKNESKEKKRGGIIESKIKKHSFIVDGFKEDNEFIAIDGEKDSVIFENDMKGSVIDIKK